VKSVAIPFLHVRDPGDLDQLLLDGAGVAVDPLQAVHVRVQDLGNLRHGVGGVGAPVPGVQVGNHLLEVFGHALELGIQILCQLVSSLPFSVHRSYTSHGLF